MSVHNVSNFNESQINHLGSPGRNHLASATSEVEIMSTKTTEFLAIKNNLLVPSTQSEDFNLLNRNFDHVDIHVSNHSSEDITSSDLNGADVEIEEEEFGFDDFSPIIDEKISNVIKTRVDSKKEEEESNLQKEESKIEKEKGEVKIEKGEVEVEKGEVEVEKGEIEITESKVEKEESKVEKEEGEVKQKEGELHKKEGKLQQKESVVEEKEGLTQKSVGVQKEELQQQKTENVAKDINHVTHTVLKEVNKKEINGTKLINESHLLINISNLELEVNKTEVKDTKVKIDSNSNKIVTVNFNINDNEVRKIVFKTTFAPGYLNKTSKTANVQKIEKEFSSKLKNYFILNPTTGACSPISVDDMNSVKKNYEEGHIVEIDHEKQIIYLPRNSKYSTNNVIEIDGRIFKCHHMSEEQEKNFIRTWNNLFAFSQSLNENLETDTDLDSNKDTNNQIASTQNQNISQFTPILNNKNINVSLITIIEMAILNMAKANAILSAHRKKREEWAKERKEETNKVDLINRCISEDRIANDVLKSLIRNSQLMSQALYRTAQILKPSGGLWNVH